MRAKARRAARYAAPRWSRPRRAPRRQPRRPRQTTPRSGAPRPAQRPASRCAAQCASGRKWSCCSIGWPAATGSATQETSCSRLGRKRRKQRRCLHRAEAGWSAQQQRPSPIDGLGCECCRRCASPADGSMVLRATIRVGSNCRCPRSPPPLTGRPGAPAHAPGLVGPPCPTGQSLCANRFKFRPYPQIYKQGSPRLQGVLRSASRTTRSLRWSAWTPGCARTCLLRALRVGAGLRLPLAGPRDEVGAALAGRLGRRVGVQLCNRTELLRVRQQRRDDPLVQVGHVARQVRPQHAWVHRGEHDALVPVVALEPVGREHVGELRVSGAQ